MSYIRMLDNPDGLAVQVFDYRDEHVVGSDGNLAQGCTTGTDGFFNRVVASGLDNSVPHTIGLTIDFLEGPRNDVVRVFVDGDLVHVDTTWEDYYRYCGESQPPVNVSRTVDSLLFLARGSSVVGNLGNGFLIDNLSLESGMSAPEDSTGEWTLYPEQVSTETTTETTTTEYRSKVRPPVNADGSSNFPARRGVIPVQFDLESATKTVTELTTETGPVVFESIGSDNDPPIGAEGYVEQANDYSFLRFVPDQSTNFADIDELVADYSFTAGNCVGGSLRWSIRVDDNGDGVVTDDDPSVFVYYGDMPNFTDCESASQSGDNLIGNSDARFDLSQLGGPGYGTYADALDRVGDVQVLRASLVLDSGWAMDQVVDLTGARVDGAEWEPLQVGTSTEVVDVTTTPFARTCDLPQAKLRWAKNDPTASGAINEATSIQPSDSGVYYRQVDCKYIYNLDVSSLDPNLGSRPGTYRVWVNIDGANITEPAKFDLK